MVLALGAYRLSKKHAIAKHLNAVESLGSVTVIATDKTGTLTENRMEAVSFEPEDAKNRLLEIGIICNDAIQDGTDLTGDPVDAALLRAAQASGLDVFTNREARPVRNEFTFDNTRKRMSTVSLREGQLWVDVKGAPESVLAQSTRIINEGRVDVLTDAKRQSILEKVAQMADDGLRVMGFAERSLPGGELTQEVVESDLTFVGLIGLADPPRPEVREAIATCQRAGVRIVMITGDHPLTAKAIARQVGLDGNHDVVIGSELDKLSDDELTEMVQRTSIYARTTPEHKLRIVQALQALGAPALSAADIGVAMGETGTDVAREAADMVLTDDNFTTIVYAVEEGRLIFENLTKGVRYYLTCKLALVLITLVPTLLLIPVPFAPVQIILMELFMDLMAAASFVAEKPESDLLDRNPRNPKARFMDRGMVSSIVVSSLGLFVAVTVVYLVTWYGTHDLVTSQTVAFFGWLIGHVLLAFNMRSERQPIFQLGGGSNPMMLTWGAAVAVFLLAISMIPGARQLMKITTLTGGQWGMILGATFIGTFWLEVKKMIIYKKSDSGSEGRESG
jgi:Ca2+-transporting ATPase